MSFNLEYKIYSNEQKLFVKKLDQKAIIPTKVNYFDAGYDLFSIEDKVIYPGQREIISTGIAMEIPEYTVGLIWPRSGLAAKKGLDVLAGVIDSTYRGEIKVVLLNTSQDETISIKSGDKIAQILIQPVYSFTVEEAESLSESDRGNKGFGSSGN